MSFLLVNPRSGTEHPTAQELCEEARSRGLDVHVLQESDDVTEVARHADADALGVAGGDGSLAAVASVAVERDLPFVCIPFGTRNHFARDAGLDRDDPFGALEAFQGSERRVDVGRVCGRVFLNNASLGLYVQLVHRRERHRLRGQALASVKALRIALRERHEVEVSVDGAPAVARIILVANNGYRLDLFSLGEREQLDGGRLHLYMATGWLPHEWDEREGERFVVDSAEPELTVALDGELLRLEPPLEFTIDPLALRLLLPPER